MTTRPPLFVANGSSGVTSPQDARLALAGLLTGAGVITGCTVTGSSSGPNMKYKVAAGVLATARGSVPADGLYLWANDGNVTVDSGAPAPSSGTRWDLVWAIAHNANDGFGDADSNTSFGVTVGTAGSSPTKPYASVPAGALVLAEASVGTSIANATLATISNVAPPVPTAWPMGVLGEASVASNTGLATTADHVSPNASACTFTLTTQRRVKITVIETLNPASTNPGHYEVQAAYTVGTAPNVSTMTALGIVVSIASEATPKFKTGTATATVTLAAGTYTAHARLARPNAGDGSTSDVFSNHYTLVEDCGPA